MGLKTQSTETELRAVRMICDGQASERTRLLSVLQDEHFVTEAGAPVWARIKGLLAHNKAVPSVSLLSQDPTLSADVQEVLVAGQTVGSDEHEVEALVEQLELFRKLRVIYEGTSQIVGSMREPTPETVETALSEMGRTIVKARSNYVDLELIHSGAGSNAHGVVDSVLSTDTPDRIKTGFSEFDKASGGFARKDLVLIAANTGGGKTVMAEQLGINAYLTECRNVALVSYEMDEEEVYSRLISNITQTLDQGCATPTAAEGRQS